MIYFIKPCLYDGPIKIGYSQDNEGIKQRLIVLNNSSPWPLEIICIVSGTRLDESWLHKCFAACHSHREWFHSHPALRETVDEIRISKTLDVVRGRLKPVGSIRGFNRKTRERISSQFLRAAS